MPRMRFWLAPHNEIPLREQLVTQIVLGILSDDLRPGTRLPSTRDLARRFHVHANTVSAAYQQLEKDRWVEFRRGSGVYVRSGKRTKDPPGAFAVEKLIADLLRSARRERVPLAALQARLQQWLKLQPPDHFLVIEPDEELRAILMHEIKAKLLFPVSGCSIEECAMPAMLAAAAPLALFSKFEVVREALPPGLECLALRVRSIPESMSRWLPARPEMLVAVASRWEGFLKSARTMLLAAGFAPEALVFRNACEPGWEKGLRESAGVVCDSLMATRLPRGCTPVVFPFLADASLQELRSYVEFLKA
jgi:GntR family transcriptional regulator